MWGAFSYERGAPVPVGLALQLHTRVVGTMAEHPCGGYGGQMALSPAWTWCVWGALIGSRRVCRVFSVRGGASALEATQRHMHGSVSQLPYKYHLEEVASVGY